jgi:hypothetical protein
VTAPLDLGAIEELSSLLEAATPGPWRAGSVETDCVFGDVNNPALLAAYSGRNVLRTNKHFEPFAVDALLLAALYNAAPQLLAAARRGLALESDIRAWMLALRVSCVESWCQSDRVNEALPELGKLIGKHVGYPAHNEKTGELGWTPGEK